MNKQKKKPELKIKIAVCQTYLMSKLNFVMESTLVLNMIWQGAQGPT